MLNNINPSGAEVLFHLSTFNNITKVTWWNTDRLCWFVQG